MQIIEMKGRCTPDSVAELRDELIKSTSGNIEIRAIETPNLSIACVQVLLSAINTWRERGGSAKVILSEGARRDIEMVGLAEYFMEDGGEHES